jgi:phosphoadenosine phosphosulfate reductase
MDREGRSESIRVLTSVVKGTLQMRDANTIIRQALREARRPCLTCSFQADGVVLLHMVRQVCPEIPVLFLDTFHHFSETLEYRDDLAARWNLNLITLRARAPRPGLWTGDTQACCARHKVEPLFEALEAYDLWLTGLRRDQSPSRAGLSASQSFRLPRTTIEKVSPLVDWTKDDVFAYADDHDIPLLPLYDAGYTSIGCEPCTSRPTDPDNPRSGRWNGQKLECGIHVQLRGC